MQKNTDCIGRLKLLWMVALGWGMLTWKHKSQKQSCSPDIDRSADSEFGVTLVEEVVLVYDKKSDEGSNSVRMRPENSGALKVVKKWLSTRVSDSSDAQLSDYV